MQIGRRFAADRKSRNRDVNRLEEAKGLNGEEEKLERELRKDRADRRDEQQERELDKGAKPGERPISNKALGAQTCVG